MIRIGTSGFSFPDWQGSFYPKWIKPEQFFDYYTRFFDTVEINLTFYALPSKDFFVSLLKRTRPDFIFTVKAPQMLTHELNLSTPIVDKFKSIIEPVVEENKLGGILAQFPYTFRVTKDNMNYIKNLRKAFQPIKMFVEFRRADWDRKEVYDFLNEENIGLVVPDLPQIEGLFKVSKELSQDISYFRFHGRNKRNWWEGKEKERYDYDYSEGELKELIEKMKRFDSAEKKVFGFFNNCFLGRAARNALSALKMLGIERGERGLFDIG
ncbi:MAG: DUF72 domain-containing protein [bacterium]